MEPAMMLVVVLGGITVMVVVYVVVIYNRLVSLRQHIRDSWAGIQVELKRRYDLIPNLVETVKGYAGHERAVLERVIELRNKAMANEGSPASQSADEVALMAGVRGMVALGEAYPDLKADTLFRQLQTELVDTEDRIAATRRFYNGNVREINETVRQFPSSIVAGMFGFESAEYFELDDAREGAAPRVDVSRPS